MFWLHDIPMPPSSNNLYATVRVRGKSRRIKSQKMRKWEGRFAAWALAYRSDLGQLRTAIGQLETGKYLSLSSNFYFHRKSVLSKAGTPKRNDTSNRLKALHDAICSVLRIDDSWIFDGSFAKRVTGGQIPEYASVGIQIIDAPWMVDGCPKSLRRSND